jgi:hypothetical protein
MVNDYRCVTADGSDHEVVQKLAQVASKEKQKFFSQTKVKLRFGLGVSEVSNRWHRRRRFHVMANCCVEWFQIQIKSFPIFP